MFSEARYLPGEDLVSFGDEFCRGGLVVGVAKAAKELLRFLVVWESGGGKVDVDPVVVAGAAGVGVCCPDAAVEFGW